MASKQPKLSMSFSSKVPGWNGEMRYKTLGGLRRAMLNYLDMVPEHVAQRTHVTFRAEGAAVRPLGDWDMLGQPETWLA